MNGLVLWQTLCRETKIKWFNDSLIIIREEKGLYDGLIIVRVDGLAKLTSCVGLLIKIIDAIGLI